MTKTKPTVLALIALVACSVAYSKSNSTPSESESPQSDDRGAQPGADGSTTSRTRAPDSRGRERRDDAIAEVVVTATKREERLKDVPISISVVDSDTLGSSNVALAEQLNAVPGVFTNPSFSGGGIQLSIRGAQASGILLGGGSPIAYYLDSVPFGLVKTSVVPDVNSYDLSRVEVLRGPQGTLYGASALNGVVRVLTQDPNLDEFELKTRASYSSTDSGGGNYRGDAAVNVPIIPGKLAARAVLGYESLSGWIDKPTKDDANEGINRNARFKIGMQPTDALSIGLSAWLSRSSFDEPATGFEDGTSRSLPGEPLSTDYDTYGLNVGYEFSTFSVGSTTGYIDYANSGSLDFTTIGVRFRGVHLINEIDAEVLSEEIVLNSTHGDAWRWSVGAFYRDAEDRLVQNFDAAGFLPAPVDVASTSKSTAVFGQLTRLLLDGKVELTAGLRYFEDKVGQRENIGGTGNPSVPLVDSDSTFHATSPRVAAAWHPSGDTTVYVSYSEGFRSGFEQQPITLLAAPGFPPTEPDTLKNYELGAKGDWLDGRASYDAAIYYIDWQDVMQQLTVLHPAVGNVLATINGESASGPGVDLGLAFRPMGGLELSLSFSWNDLAMDSDVANASGRVLLQKGDRLTLTPKYNSAIAADYTFPLRDTGPEGRFSLSGTYTPEVCSANVGGPRSCSDSILMARTSFSLRWPNRWSTSLYVDNLNNEKGTPATNVFPVRSTRTRPRTTGIQLEYQF